MEKITDELILGKEKEYRWINTGQRKRPQMNFKLGMEKITDELILGKEKEYRWINTQY
jgi:hypothetical protein